MTKSIEYLAGPFAEASLPLASVANNALDKLPHMPSPNMTTAGNTKTPHVGQRQSAPLSLFISWYQSVSVSQPGMNQFCNDHPDECIPSDQPPLALVFNPTMMETLRAVNMLANFTTNYVEDQKQYGREEYWAYPEGQGDCEDFALLKKKMLIERGFVPSALLITTAFNEQGEGHAFLTIRTTQGDFALDNADSEIMPLSEVWEKRGYTFAHIQDPQNPNVFHPVACPGERDACEERQSKILSLISSPRLH